MPRILRARPLSGKEKERVRDLLHLCPSVKEFARGRAVVLSGAGWTCPKIAVALGVTEVSVRTWVKRFNAKGVTGLREPRRSGRPRVFGERFRGELNRALAGSPREKGYAFTVWTVLSLVLYLATKIPRRISPGHLHRVLHDEGYVWRRPKHDLKHRQNRRLYRAVQRRLKDLQEEAAYSDQMVLLYLDESEVHLHPYLTGMWTRRGRQPKVPAAGIDRKIHLFGAVNYRTGRLAWRSADRKNAKEFLAFLREVVSRYPGKDLHLVLDNVAYHKTAAILEYVESLNGRIELVWLPPYSPNLNPIERVWKYIKKKYLANHFFENIFSVMEALVLALDCVNRALQRNPSLIGSAKDLCEAA